jgi:hypothetical protein
MTRNLWPRWAPLLGVVFVVLLALRLYVIGAGIPEGDASGEEVVAYYEDKEVREWIASATAVVAAAVLIFFAAHLRRVIRAAEGQDDYLSTVVLAGGILLAAALGTAEGLHGALFIDTQYLTPEAAKAINVLDQQFIFPTMLGFGTFVLASGLAILRVRVLPAWLGWAAVVVGIASFALGYPALVLALAWILVAAIVLSVRSGRDVRPAD